MSTPSTTTGRPGTWWLGPDGAPGPVLRACLRAAGAAPSVHNTQPWLFRPRRGSVDVRPDPDRQLVVIDPSGRELMLSVGAAVFNLRVAVRAHGRTPVQMFEPTPEPLGPLVRVAPGRPAPFSRTAHDLARAIPQRHSNRWPFLDLALPGEVRLDLVRAAKAEGAVLRVLGRHARHDLLRLVRVADQRWCGDPAYRAELALWTDLEYGRPDGVPAWAAGPRVADDGVPLRDLGLTQHLPLRRECRFERRPTIAVLYGPDSPRHWLDAGQALERVLLTATVHGVAASLLTQPLEIPELREAVRDPQWGMPAQAIIRLGYRWRAPAGTPRRPMPELLSPH